MMTLASFLLLLLLVPYVHCKKPNILTIIIDDLGISDLATNNPFGFHETKHIDKLLASGVSFSNSYASSCICSPSRVSILTGKYPFAIGLTNTVNKNQPEQVAETITTKLLEPNHATELPLEEVTLAEILRDNGYATAFFGKWHLGDTGYLPTDQGFDHNYGGMFAGGTPNYWEPYINENLPGLNKKQKGKYLPQRLTKLAVDYIKENRDKPWYVMLSYYTVHEPLQPPKNLERKFFKKLKKLKRKNALFKKGPLQTRSVGTRNAHEALVQQLPRYAAALKYLDSQIGYLMKKLKTMKQLDNTLVVLTSDNGGLSVKKGLKEDPPTSNLPYRTGKGFAYEGGIRVHLGFSWRNTLPAGVQLDSVVHGIDIVPTILDTAGIEYDEGEFDGLSLKSLWDGRRRLSAGDVEDRKLFWYYPHYSSQGGEPHGIIRRGRYKLIFWFDADIAAALFDIEADKAESFDLAANQPELTEQLTNEWFAWCFDQPACAVPQRNEAYSASPSGSPTRHPSFTGQVRTAGPSRQPTTATRSPTVRTRMPSRRPTTLAPSAGPTSATLTPSVSPSVSPSAVPSKSPSSSPSETPSNSPSSSPSISPSSSPSNSPSSAPSSSPSSSPSNSPSSSPTTSPSSSPSNSPSSSPSNSPSSSPTSSPSAVPSSAPSSTVPTATPTLATASPSTSPTTSPSASPSKAPTQRTAAPSKSPFTEYPSASPSEAPSSSSPSATPSATPSSSPSSAPSSSPSISPSASPTTIPTTSPTNSPSAAPSVSPSNSPSSSPTSSPSAVPSSAPSSSPSRTPTTLSPSAAPSASPSNSPTSCLSDTMDVVFVLDESGSVGAANFARFKQLLIELVPFIQEMSETKTRVALVKYQSEVTEVFDLRAAAATDKDVFVAAVEDVFYEGLAVGSKSAVGPALKHVRTEILSDPARTKLSKRKGVLTNVVLFTDDIPNHPDGEYIASILASAEADKIKAIDNTHLTVVGVEDADVQFYYDMATHMYGYASYSEIYTAAFQKSFNMAALLCS